MKYYPESVQKLIRNISKLPGIGEKTAERLTIHILNMPRQNAEELAASIVEIKEKVRTCSRCFSLSDRELCRICSDPMRSETIVCVVERPADMVALEKSGAFAGQYHILGGVLSPMDGIGPRDLRIDELTRRVGAGTVQEVILATSTSVEGDATAAYLFERLQPMKVRVTRIASGVPIGGDLQYVDQVTLRRAMETRHDI